MNTEQSVSQTKDERILDSNRNQGAKGINLFPTEVWIFPPPPADSLTTDDLLTLSINLKNNHLLQSANRRLARHCWRKNSPHLDKEFKKAFAYTQDILSAVCRKLKMKGGVREFDSWLNVIEPGGYQAVHSHAPNLLSGILFLSDCSDTSRLILTDPRPGRRHFLETQLGPTEIPVASSAGSAIIFPGWMEHWVEENNSTADKAYIEFNLGNIIREESNI